jgi:hypothetical protein
MIPSNPTLGEIITIDSHSWQWLGYWKLLPSSSQSGFSKNLLESFCFGLGSSGNLDVRQGQEVTLTQDTYLENLYVQSTGKVTLNRHRLFVAGTLILENTTNTFSESGAVGTAARVGLAAVNPTILPSGNSVGVGCRTASSTSHASITSAGVQGNGPTLSSVFTNYFGGSGGKGGKGGFYSSEFPGIAGKEGVEAGLNSCDTSEILRLVQDLQMNTPYRFGGIGGSQGSSSAGLSAGEIVSGSQGGHGGHCMFITARKLKIIGSATNVISARGGDGGAMVNAVSNASGAGGGGGGGGGFIYVIVGEVEGGPVSSFIDASGGNGGLGGNGASGALGGQGGQGGGAGRVVLINLSENSISYYQPTAAGEVPAIPATSTGSAGSPGVQRIIGI